MTKVERFRAKQWGSQSTVAITAVVLKLGTRHPDEAARRHANGRALRAKHPADVRAAPGRATERAEGRTHLRSREAALPREHAADHLGVPRSEIKCH